MAERASSAQLEARVRTLENSATRQDVRFDALLLSISELKQQARETNTLLRELARWPRPHHPPTNPTRPHGGFFVARQWAERAIP